MISTSGAGTRLLVGAFVVGLVAAGCGAATASPSAAARTVGPIAQVSSAPRTSATAFATEPVAPSGSGSSVSPSAEATQDVSAGLPHSDAALEKTLPGSINDTPLSKVSMPLSTYMASEQCTSDNPCADKALYTPWAVGFGKTPDDVTFAAATDFTKTQSILVQAFELTGVDGAKLGSAFADQARKAGWAVSQKTVADKTVEELVDPARKNLDLLSIGYLYTSGNAMYIVSTADTLILVECLLKLP